MSKLLASLSNDLLKFDNSLVNSPKETPYFNFNLEFSLKLREQLNKIPFKQYQAWIPNNAGILNWVRIGAEYEAKRRYLFKSSLFQKGEATIIPSIEIVDTDVDIDDSFSKENRLFPIFISNIAFKEFKENKYHDVTSGFGHLVKEGCYVGESTLAFFEKDEYKRLLSLKIDKKLKSSYTELNKVLFTSCHEELSSFFLKSKPIHTYHIKYTVESKGKIILEPFSLEINQSTKLQIETLLSSEGYKHIVQLLYGQIKKVFHGDSHHNHKDDVILKVYNANESDLSIPLKQMVEHMKGLEKIEKNRYKIKCKEYVPSYVHEADGILAYVEMYYENYIGKEKNVEAERYLKAAKSIHKSLKAIADRNLEISELSVNYKKKGRNIATEFPMYLFLLAFLTFLYKDDEINISNNTLLQVVKCLLNIIISNNMYFISMLLMLMFFLFKNYLDVCYCKTIALHKDFRPKDKFYAYSMNMTKITHKNKNTLLYLSISICLFLSFFIFNYLINN